MVRILKDLVIDEVSCVIKGASPGARVVLRKTDTPEPNDLFNQNRIHPNLEVMAVAAMKAHPATIHHYDASGTPWGTAAMTKDEAISWLLTDPHGKAFALHHTEITKKDTVVPQIDVLKISSIVEASLMASVVKRDGESFDKAFSRRYESDIQFRKDWTAVTEAKNFEYLKGMATLSPIVVGGEDALAANDPTVAVAAYEKLVDEQYRSAAGNITRTEAYNRVNANSDPAVRTIVAAAFRRYPGSSPSGDALQNNTPGRG